MSGSDQKVVTNMSELKLHFLPVVAVSQDNSVGGVCARLNSPVFPELRFKVNFYKTRGPLFFGQLQLCHLFVFCLSRVGPKQFPRLKLLFRCVIKLP